MKRTSVYNAYSPYLHPWICILSHLYPAVASCPFVSLTNTVYGHSHSIEYNNQGGNGQFSDGNFEFIIDPNPEACGDII